MNTQLRFLITGVSSGLGRELAEAALAAGHVVAGTVRNALDTASFNALHPQNARAVVLDVTHADDVAPAIAALERDFGPVHVLVNNAGYGHEGTLEESTMAELRRQFDVNVFGAVAMMKAVLPGMRERRFGRIINITSMAGLVGAAGCQLLLWQQVRAGRDLGGAGQGSEQPGHPRHGGRARLVPDRLGGALDGTCAAIDRGLRRRVRPDPGAPPARAWPAGGRPGARRAGSARDRDGDAPAPTPRAGQGRAGAVKNDTGGARRRARRVGPPIAVDRPCSGRSDAESYFTRTVELSRRGNGSGKAEIRPAPPVSLDECGVESDSRIQRSRNGTAGLRLGRQLGEGRIIGGRNLRT
jgi:hypothetical protein